MDEFKWAYGTFQTRCVHLNDFDHFSRPKGADRKVFQPPSWMKTSRMTTVCLVPFFDMINHSEDAVASYNYNRIEEKLEVVCKASFQRNQLSIHV